MFSDDFKWADLIFAVLLLCICVDSTAQRRMPPLDFQQFRKDIAAVDSPEEKLNRYVEMSLKAVRSRPDSLFAFAEEIRNLPGLEPSKREAFAQFILANGWRTFNRDSAIYYATRAADQLKEIGEHAQYIRTKNMLGLEYRRKSEYLKAEEAFLKGLTYSQSMDSTYYPIHYFYGNLGNLYSTVGAYNLAVEMFQNFMEYADNPSDRCNIKSRLAKNLMELEELEKAEQMLAPCLEYPDLPPPIRAITRSNLSEIVGKMGQKDRSLVLIEQAASISVEYKIPNLHIAHLIRLGNQYLDHNLTRKADSIRVLIGTTDLRGMNRHFRIEKALFYSELALASEDYEKAIAYADTAIQTAQTDDLKRFLGKVYQTKATALEKMGELDRALENMRLQDGLEEQQRSLNESKDQAMMKVRYQLQNKEDELALVNNRLAVLSEQNILLLALLVVIGFAGGYIYSRYRKSRSKEKVATSELQKRNVTISELEEKIEEQNKKLEDRDVPDWIALSSQVKLSLDEIRYIKSEGNYVKVFLSDPDRTPIIERMTLKECEEILPDELALRIHRSTIVNIRHASHINNQILFLKDDTQLKISRRYKKKLVNFLN